MNPIEIRLNLLEKKLRRYQLIFGLFIMAIVTVFITSFSGRNEVPDIIQAKKFQLVDNNGSILLEMNKESGNGSITTYTPSGKKLVRLFTSTSGCGAINSFNADGDVIFKVTNTTDQGGYLSLFNKETKEIVELGKTELGSGYLQINNKEGNKLVWLTTATDGSGYLSVFGNGNENIKLNGSGKGGRIGVYNNSNTRVCYIGAEENSDGYISTYNSAGTKLGSLPNY